MALRVRFEDLEVCEEVGRGGFGVVYRGIIKLTLTEVAIKQIDLEEQPDLDEINNEIAIILECRHPNITRFLGCFVRNYRLWVIMEYVDGGSLHELLKPAAINDELTVALVTYDLLLALDYLHRYGKIHRDLKLQNILVSKEGDVKLTDFGVLTQLLSNFSRRNTTVGTPYWMAPEVINNSEGHLFKADIWLLGCCAYEMITGKPPLQLQLPPMKALRQISQCRDFTLLIEVESLPISRLFRDFLTKCFAVNPQRRWLASQLLRHKWIVARSHDRRRLKKLITAKQLWDQDHQVGKIHNFYVPTEIANNQRKCQTPERNDAAEAIVFDMSTINLGSGPESQDSPQEEEVAATSTIKLSSPSSAAKLPLDTNQVFGAAGAFSGAGNNIRPSPSGDDLSLEAYRMPLHRVLTKVFHKLESRCALSTQQYDLLVKLNDTMLNLLQYLDMRKIVLFLYLKYFLKEVSKPSNQQLLKLIIPLNFKVGPPRQGTPDGESRVALLAHLPHRMTQFDEVEYSLFDSWIQRMKHEHKPH